MTTHERIKLALDIHSRIQNIKAIDSELTKYNLPVLQKSAALGAHKEERIKLAALLQQRSLGKQAIMGLGRAGLGAGRMLGKGLMGGAKLGGKAALGAGKYAYKNPGSAAALAGGGALAGAGLGRMAMNPATQLNKTINSGMNQVGGMYDKGMAMLGGFGRGAQQGGRSMIQGLRGAGNQLSRGFTGQLGQNSPQGATPGIAPPQQAMGAR